MPQDAVPGSYLHPRSLVVGSTSSGLTARGPEMSVEIPDGTQTIVRRTLRAPVSTVYRAFIDPFDMAAWMWGPLAKNPAAEVDLRIGGRYSVYIDATEGDDGWPGDRWGVTGVYAIIEPESRLVYTVHWDAPVGYNQVEGGAMVLDEVLIVEFAETTEGTEVVIRHAGIPDDGVSAEEHGKGLDATLDSLADLVEG